MDDQNTWYRVRHGSRSYLFGVAALATFVASMNGVALMTNGSPDRWSSRAAVLVRPAPTSSPWPANLTTKLADPEQLKKATAAAIARHSLSAHDAEALQAGLVALTDEESGELGPGVRLELGGSLIAANHVLASVAESLVKDVCQAPRDEASTIRDRAADAVGKLQATYGLQVAKIADLRQEIQRLTQLDSIRESQAVAEFAAQQDAASSQRRRGRAEERNPAQASMTDVAQQNLTPHPNWSTINAKLTALRARQAEVLQRVTPEHPLAIKLKLAIRDLEQQLQATPRFAGAESPPPRDMAADFATDLGGHASGERDAGNRTTASTAPPTVNAGATQLDRGSTAPGSDRLVGEMAPERQRVQQLISSLQEKKRLLAGSSQALESQLADAQENLLAAEASYAVWSSLSVEVVGAAPPPASCHAQSTMLLGFLIGIAGIVGMTVSAAGATVDNMLCSPAQVATALELPVIGVLAATDESPRRTQSPPRINRAGLLRTAEIVLAILLVAVSLLAIIDASYRAALWDQPLDATAEALGRLWSRWL